MAKNVHSEFIKAFLVQKDWKKFGMAKNGHSECIQTFLVQKRPKLDIQNLFKYVKVCNGLESNEICTFLGF